MTMVKLSQMDCGEEGVIISIEKTLCSRIAGVGIRIGKTVKIITKQPIKGPIVVVIDEATTGIGWDIAEKIIVHTYYSKNNKFIKNL